MLKQSRDLTGCVNFLRNRFQCHEVIYILFGRGTVCQDERRVAARADQ